MGEGFPLWSLAPMAWEGREPLRDWIYLSVSAFCSRSVSPFRVYMEIRNSDWPETFAVIFFWILAFLQRKKVINYLTGGPWGSGVRPGEQARPLPRGHLEHRLALIFLPEFSKYSKSILRAFLSRLDSVWYGYSAKHKTCNRQELALGTGSICYSKNSIKSCQKYMKVVEYWHGTIKNYRYDGDVSASPSLIPTRPRVGKW